MKFFNNLIIGRKLALGFGPCLLVIIVLVTYTYFEIQRLGAMQAEGARQTNAALLTANSLNTGNSLYRVIACAEINQDMAETKTDWATAKQLMAADMQAAEDAAVTPEEQAWVKQSRDDYEKVADVFENQMLPALEKGGGLTPEIVQLDAQIDDYLSTAATPLKNFNASLRAKSAAGEVQFTQARQNIAVFTIALGGAGFVLAALAITLISVYFSSGVRKLKNVVQGLAAGDLSRRAPVNGKDEIGSLGMGVNQMAGRLGEMLEAEKTQRELLESTIAHYVGFMNQVTHGNLTAHLTLAGNENLGEEGNDPLLTLGCSLNEMVSSFRGIIGRVREAAGNLTAASAEILAATAQQSSGASEQSAAITQTSTTVDEVKVIGEQAVLRAQEVLDASDRTLAVSSTGQQAIGETFHSMERIKERVEGIAENILGLSEQTLQIGEIIATVSTIASQSNMLALNASVEAARAGEHGKGFAVVAAEVRALAEQSRQATAQVKAILQDIQKATNATVMATEEGSKVVGQGIQQVTRTQESIAQLAQVIDEATQRAAQVAVGGRQQASGVEQIALAMQNINQAMTQGLSSTHQSERAAQELNALAIALKEMVQGYAV